MSARYGRWDLFGLDRDPVPGDETVVRQLADTYTLTGQSIAACAAQLRRLAALDGWTGEAAETFARAADDLARDLAKAERRYVDAGTALTRYVQPLGSARAQSWAALLDAVDAEVDLSRFAPDALATPVDPTPSQVEDQERRDDQYRDASARLTAARGRLDRAVADLEQAAATCARAVERAADSDRDGLWDKVKGALRATADWARLDVVVQILTAAAVAIAVVGVVAALFFTAPLWLGPALVVAGAVVGSLQLGADLVMVVGEDESGTWTSVVLDLIGLVTLGGSVLLTGSARLTATAQRATVASQAGRSAEAAEAARLTATSRARVQVRNALKSAPTNSLHIWALKEQAGLAASAAAAGRAAVKADLAAARQRTLAAELRSLRSGPDVSDEVTATIVQAQRRLRQAGRLDWAGNAVTALNVVDLQGGYVTHAGEDVDRFRWRLSR